jgi:hypothetical protein
MAGKELNDIEKQIIECMNKKQNFLLSGRCREWKNLHFNKNTKLYL